VPDEVQARLVDADDLLATQSESALIEMDQAAEHADGGLITCREDHRIVRFLGSI